jgi:hypothetical protein
MAIVAEHRSIKVQMRERGLGTSDFFVHAKTLGRPALMVLIGS